MGLPARQNKAKPGEGGISGKQYIREKANMRNKANWPAGRCRAATPNPRRAEGQSCDIASMPRFGKRTQFGPAWAGPPRAKDAKQTQFRGRGPGRRGANVQNKPNCPKRGTEAVSAVAAVKTPDHSSIPSFQTSGVGRGGHCAKQTQFPAGPAGRDRREVGRRAECAKRSQTWAGWAIWGTATRRGQLCKTNPISGSRNTPLSQYGISARDLSSPQGQGTLRRGPDSATMTEHV
jgi:hypothetical protein